MKVFITGGSGFIGTNLIGDLRQSNEIVNYDKAPSESFPELTVVGDVRDPEELTKAMQGVDVIVNLAAEHADDVSPVDLYYDVNVQGARNLVEAAVANDVKTIVFTSSVAVYGLNVGVPTETSPITPFNDYGKSKYEAEVVLRKWCEQDGSRTLVIIRPCVIFGENNRGNVYNLLQQIHSGRFIMVGSGSNRKSMGYVRNLSKLLRESLQMEPGIHIFNFADKPDVTTAELVEIARSAFGATNAVPKLPYFVGLLGGYSFDVLAKITGRKFPISSIRVRKFCADTEVSADKLRAKPFQPEFTIEEGLRRMIAHEFTGNPTQHGK